MWTIMLSENRTISFLPISSLSLFFLSFLIEVTRASVLYRIRLVRVDVLAWFMILGEEHHSVFIIKYVVNCRAILSSWDNSLLFLTGGEFIPWISVGFCTINEYWILSSAFLMSVDRIVYCAGAGLLVWVVVSMILRPFVMLFSLFFFFFLIWYLWESH